MSDLLFLLFLQACLSAYFYGREKADDNMKDFWGDGACKMTRYEMELMEKWDEEMDK